MGVEGLQGSCPADPGAAGCAAGLSRAARDPRPSDGGGRGCACPPAGSPPTAPVLTAACPPPPHHARCSAGLPAVTCYSTHDLLPAMRQLLALQRSAHAAADYASPLLAGALLLALPRCP